ncbi:hypothetical protein MPER_08384, partial [Moniliophthora perniciosa FA553]
MKTLAPPILPLPTPIDTSDYKSLANILPVQSKPKSANQMHMKTIATTRVALATDINSDGAAELASYSYSTTTTTTRPRAIGESAGALQSVHRKEEIGLFTLRVSARKKMGESRIGWACLQGADQIKTSEALWNKKQITLLGMEPDLKSA